VNAAKDGAVAELFELVVGRTTTLDSAEVDALGVVELDAEVGDGPEVEMKFVVDAEDEAGF
jgi:hypothetical protein